VSTIGLALVVTGVSLTSVATLTEAAAGWPGVRRVGRWVLAVLGPPVRPLVRPNRRADRRRLRVTLDAAIVAELRAAYAEPATGPATPSGVSSCARRGHREAWDGYHAYCRRCGARHEHVSRGGGGPWHWEWNHP
jgi:hypothetical protein